MESNILYTHIVAAALWAYVMDHIYKWNKIPWITRDTARLNAAIRAILSGFTSLGIHWAWSGTWDVGRQVTITIPALAVVGHALYNWAGQFAMQHFGERVLDIGRTWRIDPKVFDDLTKAVADAVVKQLPSQH